MLASPALTPPPLVGANPCTLTFRPIAESHSDTQGTGPAQALLAGGGRIVSFQEGS
jgi:hypothetical protein